MSPEDTVIDLPPPSLREAIAALWRIAPPGPPDLYKAPEFLQLCETCRALYPNAPSEGFGLSALRNALDTLGFPGRPLPIDPDLVLPDGLAAAELHAAFNLKQARRIYLCPLNEADDLPDLTFGPNRIAKFAGAELAELVDQPRLWRIDPTWSFDADRFSEFTWLVIEDVYTLDKTPAQRAVPILFEIAGQDWGRIQPHRGRFPAVVEDVLFLVLLAPWEDWVDLGPFWRGFEIPWIYCVDSDIFVRPRRPPSPDTLSWEPVLDDQGEEVGEWPEHRRLRDGISAPEWLNDARWEDAMTAKRSPLFETPVVHFFVKAFAEEEPMDEFLGFILTIEAALGLRSDYRRVQSDRRSATKRVADRVAALLTASEGKVYRGLFETRCDYLQGRNMDAIPRESRLQARRLARMVVGAVADAAGKNLGRQSREAFLNGLRTA